MTPVETALARCWGDFTRGAYDSAWAAIAPWRDRAADDPRVAAMLGQLLLARSQPEEAVAPLRRALQAAPENLALRTKLCFALIGARRFDECRQTAAGRGTPALDRVVAYADQKLGRVEAAIAGYRQVLRQIPDDHESWSNLGLVLQQADDLAGAGAAFDRAVALAPGEPMYRLQQSALLAALLRLSERAANLREAAEILPNDASIQVELGVAEAALDNFAAAKSAFRRALTIDPRGLAAYREYGAMLERLNDMGSVEALLAEGARQGVADPDLSFLRALALHRRGRSEEAMAALASVGDDINPARVAQLRGEVLDRLGDYDSAFDAFVEMNRLSAAEPAARHARNMDYPGEVAATLKRLTRDRIDTRQTADPARPGAKRAPIFIMGFPRSGTTLLDTMLRNLPELTVLEEPPMIEQLEHAFGGAARLTDLSSEGLNEARAAYFDRLRSFAPTAPVEDTTIVDKFPLHLVRAETIARLFPDARIVFLERHPCDVLLSCFMARFQANKAMVQFQDLDGGARLYDLAMQAWRRSEALLDLHVHPVRYEQLVAEPEPTLRELLEFLEIPWSSRVLENQRAASERPLIATASYAQVVQPIHQRSVHRWKAYRTHLTPILPLLEPWVAELGYSL